MTKTPTPHTDAEEGAIFAAFSEDRISAKQAIRAMAAESRRHEREAPALPAAAPPVEGLPEGCPETLEFFTRAQSLFINPDDYDPKHPEPSVLVEIHPVGTRARLSALERADKKGGE